MDWTSWWDTLDLRCDNLTDAYDRWEGWVFQENEINKNHIKASYFSDKSLFLSYFEYIHSIFDEISEFLLRDRIQQEHEQINRIVDTMPVNTKIAVVKFSLNRFVFLCNELLMYAKQAVTYWWLRFGITRWVLATITPNGITAPTNNATIYVLNEMIYSHEQYNWSFGRANIYASDQHADLLVFSMHCSNRISFNILLKKWCKFANKLAYENDENSYRLCFAFGIASVWSMRTIIR